MATATLQYWSDSDAFHRDQWPCRCTDPAHAYEDGSYECSHGRWLFVENAQQAKAEAEDILAGRALDLFKADSLGLLWGDVVVAWEQLNRKQETPSERAAREAREKREVEDSQKRLVESHVHKFADIYCDRKNGTLKKREMRPCKWFCACSCDRADCPVNGGKARHLPDCHKVVGKACPGGKGWTPGCAAHLKHACPFIHPDEPEWAAVASGSRPSTAGSRPSSSGSARDFSALKGAPRRY